MVMELRNDERFALNVLSYDHYPLVCDHLNRHHNATQALVALAGKPDADRRGAAKDSTSRPATTCNTSAPSSATAQPA